MNFTAVPKNLLLASALLLASTAFAATKGSLELTNPVLVNGTQLKPGDYKVQWEGTGPNVEVSIFKGKNVVAKTSAHVVDLDKPASNDAAVTTQNSSGPNTLAGLRFEGKKIALNIGEGSDSMAGGSSK